VSEAEQTIQVPYSEESEAAILGCILINPSCLTEVVQKLAAADFFLVKNRFVYEAMLALREREADIDTVTLTAELHRRKHLDECGGTAYLMRVSNDTPTWIHVGTYADIVTRCAARRRIIQAAQKNLQVAMRDDLEMDEIQDEVESNNLEAAARQVDHETISMRSLVGALYDEVGYRNDHPDLLRGIPTGLPTLDERLGGGARNGKLMIIAARPGMGKTALVMNIALSGAKAGFCFGIFSLEMTPGQLTERLAAYEANLNARRFRAGNLTEREWQQFTKASTDLSNLPIFFDGASTLRDIVNAARKLRAKHNVQAFVIDYLQLMVNCKPEHETIEVGRITRRLKLLALELDVPIYLLSQLNRNVEARQNKRPQLSDLRQSGAIEQDADVVVFIYRDVMYNSNAPEDSAELIIAKQRDGETGMVPLHFAANVTRFYETGKG